MTTNWNHVGAQVKEPETKCKYSPAGLPCFIRNPDSQDCRLCLKSQIEQAKADQQRGGGWGI